jgi:hypothetical protein
VRLVAILLLLAACAAPPARYEGKWRVLIVAGDASIAAFDNAADRLSADLAGRGDLAAPVQRYSAQPGSTRPAGIYLANVDNVLEGIAGLHPAAGQACLLFMTSHGEPGKGLYLPAKSADPFLAPEKLDRALAAGCGAAPTVVVLSGCYTGTYLRHALEKPNRIIITAARPDRSSFGCGALNTYTEFDDCFLSALENGKGGWPSVFDVTRACVAMREKTLGYKPPSAPQAFFGPGTEGVGLPWRGT